MTPEQIQALMLQLAQQPQAQPVQFQPQTFPVVPAPQAQPAQQLAPGLVLGPLGLPDGAAIQDRAQGNPFFPKTVGNFTVQILSVSRRDGFQGGLAWWITVKVLTSDQPGVLVGGVYELYRPNGVKPLEQQYTSDWLCNIVGAATGDRANWQNHLGQLLALGEETAKYNYVIGLQGRHSKKANPQTGQPYVNLVPHAIQR